MSFDLKKTKKITCFISAALILSFSLLSAFAFADCSLKQTTDKILSPSDSINKGAALAFDNKRQMPESKLKAYVESLPEIKFNPGEDLADAISRELSFSGIPSQKRRGETIFVKRSGQTGNGQSVFFLKNAKDEKLGVLKVFSEEPPSTALAEGATLDAIDDLGLKNLDVPDLQKLYRIKINGEDRIAILMDLAQGKDHWTRLRDLEVRLRNVHKNARRKTSDFVEFSDGLNYTASLLGRLHKQFPTPLDNPKLVEEVMANRLEAVGKLKEFADSKLEDSIKKLIEWQTANKQEIIKLSDWEILEMKAALHELADAYAKAPVLPGSISVIHGDAHIAQFFYDPRTRIGSFIDTEKMFEYLSKTQPGMVGVGESMADLARFYENLRARGVQHGLSEREIDTLSNQILDTYLGVQKSFKSSDEVYKRMMQAFEFYRLDFDRTMMKALEKPRSGQVNTELSLATIINEMPRRLKISQKRIKLIEENHIIPKSDTEYEILIPHGDGTFEIKTAKSKAEAWSIARDIKNPLDLKAMRRAEYDEYAHHLNELKNTLYEVPVLENVVRFAARLKQAASWRNKIVKNVKKFGDFNVEMMDDVFAFRAIVPNMKKLNETVEVLSNKYGNRVVMEKTEVSSPSGFRNYDTHWAHHFTVRPKPGEGDSLFEVQVITERALKVSLWSHDRVYKIAANANMNYIKRLKQYSVDVANYMKALDYADDPKSLMQTRKKPNSTGIKKEDIFPVSELN